MIDNATKQAYCIEMILEGLESSCKNKTVFADLRKALLENVLTDSLIDHYDRNPSNISVITDLNENIRLSPKYDNGTSLSISVPAEVLQSYIDDNPDMISCHRVLRSNVISKIGYLGRKYVKYPDLETFIFNYYFDDVKDFISKLENNFTDENIEKILNSPKYEELSDLHKNIIRGKLITNRDAMLQRYRTISKKQIIDKIIYNRAAKNNFNAHLNKGTIQEVLPEYNECVGVVDEDKDYDLPLDKQIPEKIQTIVDITQLARYFQIPIDDLTKREKNLLKWTTIMENIQKASKNPDTFANITDRLGFLNEDKELINAVIKDKFKDENDLLEARDIIYGENGIGEENLNIYIAKKFVDAACMKEEIRTQRLNELRTFTKTMKEAIELENIVNNKLSLKSRTFQKAGITDKKEIKAIQFEVAKKFRQNPRLTHPEVLEIFNEIVASRLKDVKQEVRPGIYLDKEIIEEINAHTIVLPDGKKLVLFDNITKKYNSDAFKMGADYFAQISDHFSGDGVTITLLSRKGLKFPDKVLEYAKRVIENCKANSFNQKSYALRSDDGPNASNCFVVTSSVADSPNTKIPNITAQQMCQKIKELFGVREKEEKSHLDE